MISTRTNTLNNPSTEAGQVHPKVAYLWGNTSDVFAIGSGNLTYAGQGYNLECIDFVSTDRDPGSFREVAEFLSNLITSERVQVRETGELLAQFRDRAASWSGASKTGPEDPVILHTLNRPILEQLVERLQSAQPIREVLCLSPFHHIEAEALIKLAAGVGAKKLSFGLDPQERRQPIEPKALKDAGITARYLQADDQETRPLHAKVYEFRGAQSHVLSGSVNATNASLASMTNVEVAILRRLEKGTGIRWLDAVPKPFERPTPWAGKKPPWFSLTGTVTIAGAVRGRIWGVEQPTGEWRATIDLRLASLKLGIIPVTTDGDFQFDAPGLLNETPDCVQLRLKRKHEEAAGWLFFQVDLESTPETRSGRAALSRIAVGCAQRGDVVQLLNWLMHFLYSQVQPSTSPAGKPATPPSDSHGKFQGALMTYDEWSRREGARAQHHGDLAGLARRMLTVLVQATAAPRVSPKTDQIDDEFEEAKALDNEPAPPEEFDLIADLNYVIDQVLERDPQIAVASDLLRFKARTGLALGLKTGDVQNAGGKCLEWLRTVVNLALTESAWISLREIIYAMAGLTYELTPPIQKAARAAELRQLLEKMPGIDLIGNLNSGAAAGLESELFDQVEAPIRAAASAGMLAIQTAPSVRIELQSLIAAIDAGRRPVPGEALAQTVSPAALKRLLEFRRYVEASSAKIDACPDCRCSLDSSDQQALASRRVIQCRWCGVPIIWRGM
jgi:hypothetical protein